MSDTNGIFDVATTWPEGWDKSNQKVLEARAQINRMIHLLGEMTYANFYTMDFASLAASLLNKVNDPGCPPGLFTAAQRSGINANAEVLNEVLRGYSTTLKDVFCTEESKLPPKFIECSENLNGLGLTLTYVGQTDTQKREARGLFDDGFLNPRAEGGIGDFTEKELYTTPAKDWPKQFVLMQRARLAGLLWPPAKKSGTITPMGDPQKANDFCCLDGISCKAYVGYYCSTTNGLCSLQSEPCP